MMFKEIQVYYMTCDKCGKVSPHFNDCLDSKMEEWLNENGWILSDDDEVMLCDKCKTSIGGL